MIIELFHVPVGLNVLNAGIILGLMAAPIMTSIAEDALKAVPDRYREIGMVLVMNSVSIAFRMVLRGKKKW